MDNKPPAFSALKATTKKLPSFGELQKQQAEKMGAKATSTEAPKKAVSALNTTGNDVTSPLPTTTEGLINLPKGAIGWNDDGTPKYPKGKRIVVPPRERKAQSLPVFATGYLTGPTFYRYIRLTEPEERVCAGAIAPKGGACILVSMTGENGFYFSFAVCSLEDHFIRDEAKLLCQKRFKADGLFQINNRDHTASIWQNIEIALSNLFRAEETKTQPPSSGPLVTHWNKKVIKPELVKLLVKTIQLYYYPNA